MARPSRNGTYNGEKDGFYTWNGRMWVDSRVTSFNNGNGGLPFVGDLGLGDMVILVILKLIYQKSNLTQFISKILH